MPAVNTSVQSQWVAGDNELLVSSTPVTLTAVEVQGNPTQGAVAYLRIWNSAAAVPGTTEPDEVIPIFKPNVDTGDIRCKTIMASGRRFPTALSYGVYTTPHSGSAVPTAANAPLSVKIFYIPG